jgi:dihydrofolate reductase
MRKLVAGFACSVDGYIEGPNGEHDWIVVDKEMDFAGQAKRYDTYLYGRKSYEAILAMGYPSAPGVRHYVFSTTLSKADKNFTLVSGGVKEEVQQLKEEKGKDIALYGGAGLLAALLDLELVDEFTVVIIPVLLGSGKPMVEVLAKRVWLTYKDSKTYSNGTVEVSYAVNYGQSDKAG